MYITNTGSYLASRPLTATFDKMKEALIDENSRFLYHDGEEIFMARPSLCFIISSLVTLKSHEGTFA